MIDDPLALAVQMIAVLAAGMYPIGFLFGTCSDCCCPPCGRCTHPAENGNECPREGIEWTVDFGGYGPVVVVGANFDDFTETGIVIPLEDILEVGSLPPGGPETSSGEWLAASLSILMTEGLPPEGSCCGCWYGLSLRLGLAYDNDGFVTLSRSMTATEALDECSQTAVSFEIDEPWVVIDSGPDYDGIPESVALEWANSLDLSASFEIEACECGACCEDDGTGVTCSDNVAEGGCPGDWQGVDTLCENVTCGGTCCDAATGNCTYTLEEQCAGTWTAGGECDPNPCPQPPEGACCDGEGNCTQTIEADCSGEWSEGVECDPNPCPQLGSCCNDGECTETLEANCAGTWTEGESCEPNPCDPVGWCCEYFEGDLVIGFGPITEGACQAFTGDGFTYTWTEGAEIECPPTNP